MPQPYDTGHTSIARRIGEFDIVDYVDIMHSMVNVLISDAATRQLADLPITIIQRISDVLERLHRWPDVSGAKPLRHRRKGQYRIRTGDYRIIFEVSGNTLLVIQVGHRKDVYED